MTVELSKEAENALNSYLSEQGLAQDAAPNIIEEALETFLFKQVLRQDHILNKDLAPEEAESLAEEAVRAYRKAQL